ncbi:hypothetical protein [Streptomonospora salina]|uniref:Septum formation-related domain-containing protein n=1 Tax=Streptomonospora salina TaxID=104205 RepID=A0A841E3U3_9ACTN|nr:hypothetical protein [Streptomonospora salina]MBB5998517.1 hypothetical protein [Streptomonospora salina]
MRSPLSPALGLVVVAALSACSPETTATADGSSPRPSPEPSAPAAASETPSPSPEYDEGTFEIECYYADSSSAEEFTDVGDAWEESDDIAGCSADYLGGDFTDKQDDAYEAAGYGNRHDLATLYELCAEPGGHVDTLGGTDGGLAPDQVEEFDGMLVLCPDHPQADAIREALDTARADAQLEEEGRKFDSGTFLVGDEIQPGTYYSEGRLDGCYWERTDSAGEIIDNNFISSGRRVQTTVAASDYSFHSRSCGTWRPVS